MPDRAVFLDRDNTLIEDPGYLSDPDAVKLLPGVDLAIKSLRQAGFKLIVVTNQSGIARGLITEETLEAIHTELRRQLDEKDAPLDAIYYCPYHPEGSIEQYARESDLRKPQPGMLLAAAEAMDLDLSASWLVGDSARDVGAGQHAGCRTVRLRGSEAPVMRNGQDDDEEFQADFSVRNLVDAARVIMRESARGETDSPADTQCGTLTPAETKDTSVPLETLAEESLESAPPPLPPKPREGPGHPDSEVRKEILSHVRQMARGQDTEEFSIANLLGGISQVFVGLFLLLVFWYGIGENQYEQATLWAVVAVVFQTMALTFFQMAQRKK